MSNDPISFIKTCHPGSALNGIDHELAIWFGTRMNDRQSLLYRDADGTRAETEKKVRVKNLIKSNQMI